MRKMTIRTKAKIQVLVRAVALKILSLGENGNIIDVETLRRYVTKTDKQKISYSKPTASSMHMQKGPSKVRIATQPQIGMQGGHEPPIHAWVWVS